MANLQPEEIFGQVLFALQKVGSFPTSSVKVHTDFVDNIVLMGQGEPLYNYKNVKQAIHLMMQHLNYTPWRITLSTSGVVPLIPKVASEIGCALAISLHATNDKLRDELVPLNKTFNIKSLITSCEEYLSLLKEGVPTSTPKSWDVPKMKKQKQRITFEYVLLRGVNDSIKDANALVRLVNHLPSHVNLMGFNEWKGSGYTSTSAKGIAEFADVLRQNGVVKKNKSV